MDASRDISTTTNHLNNKRKNTNVDSTKGKRMKIADRGETLDEQLTRDVSMQSVCKQPVKGHLEEEGSSQSFLSSHSSIKSERHQETQYQECLSQSPTESQTDNGVEVASGIPIRKVHNHKVKPSKDMSTETSYIKEVACELEDNTSTEIAKKDSDSHRLSPVVEANKCIGLFIQNATSLAPLELLPKELFSLILKELSVMDISKLYRTSKSLELAVEQAPKSVKPVVTGRTVITNGLVVCRNNDNTRWWLIPINVFFAICGQFPIGLLELNSTDSPNFDFMLEVLCENMHLFSFDELAIDLIIAKDTTVDMKLLEQFLRHCRYLYVTCHDEGISIELDALLSGLKYLTTLLVNYKASSGFVANVVKNCIARELPLLESVTCDCDGDLTMIDSYPEVIKTYDFDRTVEWTLTSDSGANYQLVYSPGCFRMKRLR